MENKFTCYVVGEKSLLIKCSEILLERGHKIYGIVSSNPKIKKWAADHTIETFELNGDLSDLLNSKPYDYIFSIANLSILSDELINSPQKCAINFHDGPLPDYAGRNVTSWAIMNQAKTHGITWHEITTEVDGGDIFKQVVFELAENETSLSLNARCFESGFLSFEELVDELVSGTCKRARQNSRERNLYGQYKRPDQAAVINWQRSAEDISAMARALDFGRYENPLGLPKVKVGGDYFAPQNISVTDMPSTDPPGMISSTNETHLRVATGTNDIEFDKGLSLDGVSLSSTGLICRYALKPGLRFEELDDESAAEITKLNSLIAKHEAYWVKQLSALEFVDLHYAKKRLGSNDVADFDTAQVVLPEAVISFFNELDPKPNISLAAAFSIFLGRHCGKDEFNIGYTDEHLLNEIGEHGSLFSKYVPLRVTINTESSITDGIFGIAGRFEIVTDKKTYARDVWGRYTDLRRHIKEGRQSISPVNIFYSENPEGYEAQPGSMLTLVVSSALRTCSFIFDSSAINVEDIQLFKAQFNNFLDDAAANSHKKIADLCILSANEKDRLFLEWNDTKVDFPATKCTHHLFEEQAARTPEATALICRDKKLDYRELNRRANQVAQRLQELGVGIETIVGIYLNRSVEMVVAVMATLKAGGAYVPLDPSFPEDRISYMIEDSKCPVIITEMALIDNLGSADASIFAVDNVWAEVSDEKSGNIDCGVTPKNLAYVIYTSGSTGKPKGVMIEHRNVSNFLTGMDISVGYDPGSTLLAVTSLSFDISVLEIFWTLSRGFKVVIYPGADEGAVSADMKRPGEGEKMGSDEIRGPRSGHAKHLNDHPKSAGEDRVSPYYAHSIPELIKLHKVTHFQCTPSLASMLMMDENAKEAFSRLEKFLIGGEAFPTVLANQLKEVMTTGDLINMYGPTETTVWSTTFKLSNGLRSIPIGKPIANTEIRILDKNLQPVPIGVPGELMIGGEGVVRGYYNRPELTAERFISNPFSAESEDRLYRTGDLVRYLADGNIEFLGRMDYQVKLRGYRIELGEIESLLNNHPAVHESVVIAREDVPGQKKLVAYVIAGKGEHLNVNELRSHAKKYLPDYMVPSFIVFLDTFPQTPNKKIDRKALPPPDMDRFQRETTFNPPRTDIEEALADLWAEILGVRQVGRDENFFDLGGDSISATMIILGIQRTCQVDLPIHSLFRAPTVSALAENLEAAFLRQAELGYTIEDLQEDYLQPVADSIDTAPPVSLGEERFEPPRTPTEKSLAVFWAKSLRVERVGRHDHFFQLGGKSITAVNLLAQIEAEFGRRLPLSIMLHAPTLYQLAGAIDKDSCETGWSPLVPIQSQGSKLPFFCIHAHRGNVLNYYPLAQYIGSEQPFYGLQARGLDGNEIAFRTFTDMAADYINEIRTVQPVGPYILGGWCLGGYIALEMAHLLKAAGEDVALLALIDAPHPSFPKYLPRTTIFHRIYYKLIERIDYELGVILALNQGAKMPHLWRKIKALIPPIQVLTDRLLEASLGKLHLKIPHSQAYKLQRLYDLHDKAFKAYNPTPYHGRVVVFPASKQTPGIHPDPALGWGNLFNGKMELREIPGHYISILVEPSIRFLADELKDCLNRIEEY